MAYEVEPYIGVGPIRFGMAREDVRAAIVEHARSVARRGSGPPSDYFDVLGLRVDYREPDLCTFVESGGPVSPTLHGHSFLNQPFRDALAWLEARDPDLSVDGAGLRSPLFGIALYAPSAQKQPERPVEGIAAFERGYYERSQMESQRRMQEMAQRYGVKIRPKT